MSLLGSMLLAWASVHAYVAVFTAALYWPRRRRSLLAFSLLSACMALFTVGAVLQVEADTPRAAMRAADLRVLAALLLSPLCVQFARALTSSRRPGELAVCYGLSGVGILASWFGLMYAAAPDASLQPVPRWPFYPFTAMGFLMTAHAVRIVYQRRSRLPSGKPLLAMLALALMAGGYDAMARMGLSRQLFVSEQVFAIVAVTMAWELVLRQRRADNLALARGAAVRHKTRLLLEARQAIGAQRPLAMVGELASLLAREVRAPVDQLLASLAALRHRDADRPAILVDVERSVARLDRLVQDLLRYTRPLTLDTRALNVPVLLEHAAEAVSRDPAVASVSLQVADPLPALRADADLIEQALSGMLHCASRGSGTPRPLILRVEPCAADGDGVLRFEVVSRAAVRWPQPGDTPESAPEIGLTVLVVERIVEAHGGHLTRVRRPEGGHALRLDLPAFPPGDGVGLSDPEPSA